MFSTSSGNGGGSRGNGNDKRDKGKGKAIETKRTHTSRATPSGSDDSTSEGERRARTGPGDGQAAPAIGTPEWNRLMREQPTQQVGGWTAVTAPTQLRQSGAGQQPRQSDSGQQPRQSASGQQPRQSGAGQQPSGSQGYILPPPSQQGSGQQPSSQQHPGAQSSQPAPIVPTSNIAPIPNPAPATVAPPAGGAGRAPGIPIPSTCPVTGCTQSFSMKKDLEHHVMATHGPKAIPCTNGCGKGFSSFAFMNTHQKNGACARAASGVKPATGAQPQICKWCNAALPSVAKYDEHFKNQHPNEVIDCGQCDRYGFDNILNLHHHQGRHPNPGFYCRGYGCGSGTQDYQTRIQRDAHIRSAHIFCNHRNCPKWSSTFEDHESRIEHMRTAHGLDAQAAQLSLNFTA